MEKKFVKDNDQN